MFKNILCAVDGSDHALRAAKTAAELAARYINERYLPDKAIDVIDEAGANQRLQPVSKRKKTVGVGDREFASRQPISNPIPKRDTPKESE